MKFRSIRKESLRYETEDGSEKIHEMISHHP